MTPMALDILIGSIILLSAVIAYFRGFVKEVFTLAGLALAILTAYKGGHLLVPGLNKMLNVPPADSAEKGAPVLGLLEPAWAAKAIAYGGTFLLVFILMTVLGFLITLWLKKVGMGVIDRLLGAGFGVLRGFLLVFIIYVPITFLINGKIDGDQEKFPRWARDSKSVPILQKTLVWMNETVNIDKLIEDSGDRITIKLDKIDVEKLGKEATKAAEDLKEEVKKEETETKPAEAPAPAPVLEPTLEPVDGSVGPSVPIPGSPPSGMAPADDMHIEMQPATPPDEAYAPGTAAP